MQRGVVPWLETLVCCGLCSSHLSWPICPQPKGSLVCSGSVFCSHFAPCFPPASVFASLWTGCSWARGVCPHLAIRKGLMVSPSSPGRFGVTVAPTQHHAAALLPRRQPNCLHLATRNQYGHGTQHFCTTKKRCLAPSCLPPDKHYGVSMPHGHPQGPIHLSHPSPQQGPVSSSAIKSKPKPIQQFSTPISSQPSQQSHSQPELH